MICGLVSGGLEVLDFEEADVFNAFVDRAIDLDLTDVVLRVAAGYHQSTPGGGVHLLYSCDTVGRSQKLACRAVPPEKRRHSRDTTAVLIETRGQGAYAILAPSHGGVHPTGNAYRVMGGSVETIATITSTEREALLNIARSLDEAPAPQRVVYGAGASSGTGNRPGDDFNRRASWDDVLVPHGWTRVDERDGIVDWRRPGKDHGTSATTNHGDLDLLFVFSTSTPFDTDTWYTKFAAYALLNHGGDFSAEARELAAQGYGSPAIDVSQGVPRGSWPEPLGNAAYHGLLGDIVRTIEPHTEADPAALLFQLLVPVGSVVGRAPHFMAEADRHTLNLFVVLVGETAKGRKGTSQGRVAQLFELAEAHVIPHASRNLLNVNSGLSSGEGLIWTVRDPIPKDKDPGVTDKRLVVLEPEFASTLRVLGRDGNTLSAVIRNAWDTGDLATLTKNSPARATGAHISIVGHVTRGELVRELTRTEAANGFANRFLWVSVRRSKQLPEGGQVPQEDLEWLARCLGEVVQFAHAAGQFKRDDEARRLWHEVYGPLSEGKPGLLGAMIARAEAQVMRIACIYAVMDESEIITHPHLEAALEVWRYAEDSARYVFGDALGDPVADEILRALRAHPDGMTRTDLRDLFGRNRKAAEITRALHDLADRGLAQMEMQQTGGRAGERWLATTNTTKTTGGSD